MSRKTRKVLGVLSCVIGGVILIAMGVDGFMQSPRWMPDSQLYFLIIAGVACFVVLPFGLRNIDRTEDKKDEMNAMLEDYRQRKNRP